MTVDPLTLAAGNVLWKAGAKWGPSYASPGPATLHGKRRVLVFAGGRSNPPTGGLERARAFTWDECARRHEEVYRELAESS